MKKADDLLTEARSLSNTVRKFYRREGTRPDWEDCAIRLAEVFWLLDMWMSGGQLPPADWKRKE